MKSKVLASLLGICLLTAILPAKAETREFPAGKTGTGMGHRYNLGAVLSSDRPAVYYIALALPGTHLDLNANDGHGHPLAILDRGTRSALLSNFTWLKYSLSREQLEDAVNRGLAVHFTLGAKERAWKIDRNEFLALMRDADEHDDYRKAQELAAKRADEAKRKQELVRMLVATFRADSLAGFARKGTGKIDGQAFLKTRSGEVRVGAGNDILLLPATEWILTVFDSDISLTDLPEAIQTAIAMASRTTQADGSGAFEFSGLPPGLYRMQTSITWEVPGQYGGEQTGGLVTRLVDVHEGESVRAMLTR